MKLTGSTVGLVGCTVPTIAGLACSASATSTSTVGLSFSSQAELNSFVGGACVNSLLDEKQRTLLAKNGIDENVWNTLTNKFGSTTGPSKGCVAVSWNKETWSGGYWKGIIRYEWLFSRGSETLVVHGFFDSNETGITNKNWKAVYINTQGDKKAWLLWNDNVSSNADLGKKMPKNPKFSKDWEEYWRFNPDYTKKCSGTHCKDSPWRSSFENKWKWHSHTGGTQEFSHWTDNYSEVFGENNTDKRLEALNAAVKEKGVWESF